MQEKERSCIELVAGWIASWKELLSQVVINASPSPHNGNPQYFLGHLACEMG